MNASICRFRHLLAALMLVLTMFASPSRAEIGTSVTSDSSNYVRGTINTFVFHLMLYSEVFETADNIHFAFPAGVTISSIRIVDGNHTCPDALLLALGLGTSSGGWFNPGHPSGCGFFFVSSAGSPHTLQVDVDIPSGFGGPLRVDVHVDGDECCGPPPHAVVESLTFADAASPALWDFEDAAAPALPIGWETETRGNASPWRTVLQTSEDGSHAMFGPLSPYSGETFLTSPSVAIGPHGSELRFSQRLSTEEDRDGGVLEIAVDGGPFEDIEAAGGLFRAGGYGPPFAPTRCPPDSGNPLEKRRAWSGVRDTFGTIVQLPSGAAGHSVRLRWRLGMDCADTQGSPSGWWIDDVRLVAQGPLASVGPDKITARMPAGIREEALHIANPGAGLLSYSVVVAPDEGCNGPIDLPWLHVGRAGGSTVEGSVAGGESDSVVIEIDDRTIARGTLEAAVCVSNNASSDRVAIPVHVESGPGSPCVSERLFANGFDDESNGLCGVSLRTFKQRDAFIAEIAPGYSLEHFTGLRTGPLHGPVEFGNDTYIYSVYSQENAVGGLTLFSGSGVLSTTSAADQLVITFTGAPVNAVGGNFWPTSFFTQIVPPLTVILQLDDGSKEVFTSSGRDDFRGFIASRPIHSLTITAPDTDPDGDIDWGVFDNVVVGRAR